MLKNIFAVLLVTAAMAGCAEKETVKTETVPVDRNVTINNPPPAPAQNTNTVVHDRTVIHDQAPAAPAAPAGNTTINNNNNATPKP
jgi:hypothetical protein